MLTDPAVTEKRGFAKEQPAAGDEDRRAGRKTRPYCSAGQAGAPAPCVQEAGAVPEVHGKASRPQISSLTLKKKKK